MVIEVKDKWALLVKDDTLLQNAKKTYEAEFVFDESWDGFAKTAIFEAGPASVEAALTEDRCGIPAECLKRGSVKLRVGVYGVKGDERKGTVWCETSMIVPALDMDVGSLPGPCLPDERYDQIMAAIGNLSAAGFEGKSLAEIILEIKNSVCETATDEEIAGMIGSVFGPASEESEGPVTDIFG